MKPIQPENIHNLLVRSTNWIGDAIMTTPAIRAIRILFPNSKITILTKPWVAPVFENSNYVDSILIYDSEGFHKGFKGKLRLAKELKREKFDSVILLQNAFEAAFITYLAKIPIRIGYNRDARRIFLTHPIKCTKKIKKIHQTGYYLQILKGIGLDSNDANDTTLDLNISEKEDEVAQVILQNSGILKDNIFVGINPSATFGSAKQWLPERFAKISDEISEKYNAKIAIFGGPGDRKLGEHIATLMKTKPVDFSGKTSLREAMALINQTNLFITNDSGLMHVATALDRPLIAIFGSTNAIETGPIGSQSRIIKTNIECSPCMEKVCPKGHHQCMKDITVDMVFSYVKEILN